MARLSLPETPRTTSRVAAFLSAAAVALTPHAAEAGNRPECSPDVNIIQIGVGNTVNKCIPPPAKVKRSPSKGRARATTSRDDERARMQAEEEQRLRDEIARLEREKREALKAAEQARDATAAQAEPPVAPPEPATPTTAAPLDTKGLESSATAIATAINNHYPKGFFGTVGLGANTSLGSPSNTVNMQAGIWRHAGPHFNYGIIGTAGYTPERSTFIAGEKGTVSSTSGSVVLCAQGVQNQRENGDASGVVAEFCAGIEGELPAKITTHKGGEFSGESYAYPRADIKAGGMFTVAGVTAYVQAALGIVAGRLKEIPHPTREVAIQPGINVGIKFE